MSVPGEGYYIYLFVFITITASVPSTLGYRPPRPDIITSSRCVQQNEIMGTVLKNAVIS